MLTNLTFVAFVFIALACYEFLGVVTGTVAWVTLFIVVLSACRVGKWFIGDPLDAYDRERATRRSIP